ncbi:hypothetical protein F5148DRAFT_1290488 [Russula earlei]|uniref:Uncharacterized protein n=1 Tax=Russula earlei TaxID=71964 RepID=A0ACC0TVJ5_9AGAM|nr:hypothetical protein F5148DRAFT_1290488 [Russula earlei]
MTEDICDKFIGPMPILKFFSDFVPQASQARETNEISFAETSISQCEDQFAIQLSGLAPDLTFVNTSAKQDKQSRLRPDIAIYWNKNAHSKVTQENKKLEWSVVDVWIKNKNRNQDIFCTLAETNPPEDESDLGCPIRSSHRASHICGQLISYSLVLHQKQSCVFSFAIILFGETGRLLQWDHSGAIYTELFNWAKDPNTLFKFIWRLNSLTFAQHGYGTTVTSVLENDEGILINDDHATDGQLKPYITWKPIWETKTLFGQSTFRYICHDIEQNELVYLKDYWHTDFPGIEKEGDIYHDL